MCFYSVEIFTLIFFKYLSLYLSFYFFYLFISKLATRTDLFGVKIRATLVAYQLWYIYCEKCRERALKAIARQRSRAGADEPRPACAERAPPDLDHRAMRDNATFLLDLAPLINSGSLSICITYLTKKYIDSTRPCYPLRIFRYLRYFF